MAVERLGQVQEDEQRVDERQQEMVYSSQEGRGLDQEGGWMAVERLGWVWEDEQRIDERWQEMVYGSQEGSELAQRDAETVGERVAD